MRDRNRQRLGAAELLGDPRERREAFIVQHGDLRQVVTYEPVAADVLRVEREHDDAQARDTPELGDSPRQSDQWCIVSTASAASNESSSKGSSSAAP